MVTTARRADLLRVVTIGSHVQKVVFAKSESLLDSAHFCSACPLRLRFPQFGADLIKRIGATSLSHFFLCVRPKERNSVARSPRADKGAVHISWMKTESDGS